MDPVQIVIVFVSVTLTTIIAILSIQVWNILKEFRITIQKINKILDDTGSMTGNASQTVEGITGALAGMKGIFSIISSFRKRGE